MEKRHIKRITTDDPQDNVENMFNLAFVKDGQVWMRCCGEDDKDCTLVSFIKQICRSAEGGCLDIPKTDDAEEFSCSMMDCAFDLCPVANVYFGLVQAAELRSRLKAYEDALPLERAKALSEADADMRLMVMPELPQDMGDPMEPLKIEAAARSVFMKIDYLKEKDPSKISPLDYTLYACCYHALEQKRDELLAKESKADD